MPTGYTQKVYDGTITDAREYLRYCIGAFLGDSYPMGEVPLKVEPSDYYKDSYEEQLERIEEWESFNLDQRFDWATAEIERRETNEREYYEKNKGEVNRYFEMLEKLGEIPRGWDDEGFPSNVLDFAEQQLYDSIKYDKVVRDFKRPERSTEEDVIRKHEERLYKDRDDYKERYLKELARVKNLNEWLDRVNGVLNEKA